MKNVNFSFKNHFVHRLYAYILLVILVPSVLVYGIILWTNPKAEEKFAIFVDGNLIDNKAFESFIKENTNIKNILVAGGVSANKYLREKLTELANKYNANFHVPDFIYCTDNAAMIGAAAYPLYLRGEFSDYSLNAESQADVC